MGTKRVRTNPDVEVIGHRGHVSQFPENTIEGFLSALSLGVDGLEMDLVISGDDQVVVSHEPFMSSSYMLSPNGKRVTRSKEKELILYHMPYDSIKRYDSGSRKNIKFETQKRIKTYKPLLEKVFQEVEEYRKRQNLKPVDYYLEIKSTPEEYGNSQPKPPKFVNLVMQVVRHHDLEERVVIMSFDAGVLNEVKKEFPNMKTSYLVYRTEIQEGLKRLNFKPEVISPYYKQLKSAQEVAELQKQGLKVIPWTVNSNRKIKRMIEQGVNGVISDYPERVLDAKKTLKD